MSICATLRTQHETLQGLFDKNRSTVQTLQRTLSDDILPGLIHELEVGPEHKRDLERWVWDEASIFRILKRHKFTYSFALDSLQSTLKWRVSSLPPPHVPPPTPFLRCLPSAARDPFGRPIVAVRLAELNGDSENLKSIIIRNMELFRLHLERLNDQKEDLESRPVLQYVVLLDIQHVSFSSVQNIDLLSWYINELLPRFPGMLAAVFVLNYSWAYNGLWNIAKRTLPASALCKVFFPSRTELLDYFSPDTIPQDYGGVLPPLSELDDPLHPYVPPTQTNPDLTVTCSTENPTGPFSCPPAPDARRYPSKESVSRTSVSNPFYGYPITYASSSSSTPTLRYGRRRKRDLFRTLIQLWWMRWRVPATVAICVFVVFLLALVRRNARMRRWRWRWAGLPGASVI